MIVLELHLMETASVTALSSTILTFRYRCTSQVRNFFRTSKKMAARCNALTTVFLNKSRFKNVTPSIRKAWIVEELSKAQMHAFQVVPIFASF